MNRRNFFKLTGTYTGGMLLLPDFLHAFAHQEQLKPGDNSLVFIQLFGGNDGLNTYIPYTDELYYKYRPNIAIAKDKVIGAYKDMAFHPALKGLANIQQEGNLSVIQNVGYPEPDRSHFRSREIWETASDSDKYLTNGWLGRFLDLNCNGHQPLAGLNVDDIDSLSLKGLEPNSITTRESNYKSGGNKTYSLSGNPELDFVRRIANSASEGASTLSSILNKTPETAAVDYPKSELAKNLKWMARLIKGGLNSKVYYTSLNGFDTHEHQLGVHNSKLAIMGDAVYAFYSDLKKSGLLNQVTIVIFSEFGRRVQDNGGGTDHGTAAPMFVIGGNNKGNLIGKNPDLVNLDKGDLIYDIDFRSVYASLLKDKFAFDPKKIGIANNPLRGLFS
nr:DUF1501 domain-containing protein [uncultured Flavobacterium sp.]